MMLIVRLTFAVIAMAAGIAGLILPILPGWLFFGVALVLLFPQSRLAVAAVRKLDAHAPRAARVLRAIGVSR